MLQGSIKIFMITNDKRTLVGLAPLERLDDVALAVSKKNLELNANGISKKYSYSIEMPVTLFTDGPIEL